MKFVSKGKKTYYNYNVEDFTDEEKVILKRIAIERFAEDEHAQLEYAVLSILNEMLAYAVMGETKNGNTCKCSR
jgi:hypothetical protein